MCATFFAINYRLRHEWFGYLRRSSAPNKISVISTKLIQNTTVLLQPFEALNFEQKSLNYSPFKAACWLLQLAVAYTAAVSQ